MRMVLGLMFHSLLLIGMVVFGGLQTAVADVQYSFTTIDVPGATNTFASGINASGQIVDVFQDALGLHGFLLDTDGSITTIDVPGSTSTQAFGINDSGQIVGEYSDSTGGHAFLATPVSPGLKTERRTQGISELPR